MDAICFGSIIVDHRQAASAEGAAEPLRIVEKAVDLHVGGVAILAAALKRIGFDVALMGLVGRDIAGCGLKAYLENEAGLNVEAVKLINAPTSSSFIRLTRDQRYVDHTPGASAELLPGDSELAFVAEHKPALMAIGYAGLLPKLDADGGRRMSEWIAAVQEQRVLVALDTHTVPPYAMLEMPVRQTDLFVCNEEEGHGITNLDAAGPQDVLAVIWSKFRASDPGRWRLFGVTTPRGAQLAYGRGDEYVSQWLANPDYGTFAPMDLTGAGDYFRAGLYAEILSQPEAFTTGRLDLARAGLAGHRVACERLRRGPSDSRAGSPTWESVEGSGRSL